MKMPLTRVNLKNVARKWSGEAGSRVMDDPRDKKGVKRRKPEVKDGVKFNR